MGDLSRSKAIVVGCNVQEKHFRYKVIGPSHLIRIVFSSNGSFGVDFGFLVDI
jgi:hypothetical protein